MTSRNKNDNVENKKKNNVKNLPNMTWLAFANCRIIKAVEVNKT